MRLRFQLLIVMVVRTIFNTMHRMVYPFLGTFARGLGVDITALSFALTGHSLGRALGAFLAPFIYRQFGFLFVALLAVVFNVFGLFGLYRLQKDGKAR